MKNVKYWLGVLVIPIIGAFAGSIFDYYMTLGWYSREIFIGVFVGILYGFYNFYIDKKSNKLKAKTSV
ncbi:MAG: hypothetical protein LBP40_05255 [Campylobacteraceae bacterium]|jgi:hypothetical protein|nr:hypothetical protein [Campylobacteraceae bacterium]